MRRHDYELEVVFHHATARAIKVSLTGEAKDAVWPPSAAVDVLTPLAEEGRMIDIRLSEDLAIEKGLA